jgi:hypothetical protein
VGRKRKDEPRLDLSDPHLPRLADGDSLTDEQIAMVVRYKNAGPPKTLMPKMVQAVRDQLFDGTPPFPAGTEPDEHVFVVHVWDRIVLIGEKYHPELWAWFDERNRRQNAEEKLWRGYHQAADAIRESADATPPIEPILWMLEQLAASQQVAGAMEEQSFGDNRGPETAELIYEWVQRCRAALEAGDPERAGVAMFAAMRLLHDGGFLDQREQHRFANRSRAIKGGRAKAEYNSERDADLIENARSMKHHNPALSATEIARKLSENEDLNFAHGPLPGPDRIRKIIGPHLR